MAAATSEVVDSSRRVLDDEGQWERLKAERLNTPARRTRVGMKAPPRTLGQAIVRHSHHKSMKKPQVSHKMPKLDLSSIAMVYGTASDALRDAAIPYLPTARPNSQRRATVSTAVKAHVLQVEPTLEHRTCHSI